MRGLIATNNLPRWTCGAAAGILSLVLLWTERGSYPLLFASLFLVLICISDTLYARIPNALILLLTLAGFACHAAVEGPMGLLTALAGLATGLALLLIPYALGGMGAGDVKALGALGSVLGAGAILQVFFYMALAGGLLAVAHYLFNRNLVHKSREWLLALKAFFYTRDVKTLRPASRAEALRFPYAAAIAFGFFAYVRWGGLI